MATLLVFSLAQPAARAESAEAAPQTLTSRGRVMISGALGGSWSDDNSGTYGALRRWSVYGAPATNYFVRDHIGIGLALSAGRSRSDVSSPYPIAYYDTHLALGVTGAFELPLSSRFSLMFQPFVGYLWQWQKVLPQGGDFGFGGTPTAAGATFQQPRRPALHLGYVRVAVSFQLFMHLSESLGLGLGPDVWLDIFLDGAARQVGEPGLSPPPFPRAPGRARLQVGLSAAFFVSF